MPPTFVLPPARANVFARPTSQHLFVNHAPVSHPSPGLQRLPNEILLRIITFRIEDDILRLLLEAPSDYSMWAVAHFSTADTLVTEKRIAFRRHALARDLRNLARVSTFCMDTIQRLLSTLRPQVEARYWKVFDFAMSHRDRPRTYMMFSDTALAKTGAGCCKFHNHRQLTVKSHEEAVSLLYSFGRLIADVKDDGTRPCVDALLREVK